MTIIDPRTEILPDAQKLLWPSLRKVTDLDFVLYGGTAVALQLGHRASIDFDFFTRNTVDAFSLTQQLTDLLGGATTLQSEPNTLTVSALVPGHIDSVKLSFFGGLSWALQSRAHPTRDGVLQVASLEDLMATKLVVLQKRVEVKDYLDIAAMLTAGIPLRSGLARAKDMYGSAFQPAESLKAMVYFADGDFDALSGHDRATLIDAARSIASATSAQQTPRSGVHTRKPKSRGR